jgi:ABC-type antimicrobial peptide transport system, ATPase component
MIEVKNVSKYYTTENTVSVGIKNVTTSFRLGEFVAVTGESGSGKSTFLNCLGGIDTYEEGEIIAFNEDTSGFSKEEWENYRKKYNSFIFQDYNILPSYSVAENIEMALLTTCPDKHEREKE